MDVCNLNALSPLMFEPVTVPKSNSEFKVSAFKTITPCSGNTEP